MSNPVRVIPLGGIGEIGRNITVIEQGDELILVDCGISFPREEGHFGADIVVPDFAYLAERQHAIRALVVTHGHEDHIGAIPFLLRELKIPQVWATRFTLGLIKSKVDEFGLLSASEWCEIKPDGEPLELAGFELEFIRVSHSIPDCVALAIHTDQGTIVHSGDIKLDASPLDGVQTDLANFAELGSDGVQLYLGDSTNADIPGHSKSERSVAGPIRDIFSRADGRIVACCFSSHIHRLQQFIDIAHEHKRAVCILGRSMLRNTNIARNLGYMDIGGTQIIKPQQMADLDPSEVLVLCTGSQGEPFAAMNRYAWGTHPTMKPDERDTVIFSSRTIPGNELRVHRVINQLSRVGADIVHNDIAHVHVSGHGASEELKTLLQLIRPTAFMPVHGEWRHLRAHAHLARMVGVPEDKILFGENGSVVELRDGVAALTGEFVRVGQNLVDRTSNEHIVDEVMEQRQQASGDGLLVVVAHRASGELEVVARGVQDDDGSLVDDARDAAVVELDNISHTRIPNGEIEETVREAVVSAIWDHSRRSPLVVPVVFGDE